MAQSGHLADCEPSVVHLEYILHISECVCVCVCVFRKLRSKLTKVKIGPKPNEDSMDGNRSKKVKWASKP